MTIICFFQFLHHENAFISCNLAFSLQRDFTWFTIFPSCDYFSYICHYRILTFPLWFKIHCSFQGLLNKIQCLPGEFQSPMICTNHASIPSALVIKIGLTSSSYFYCSNCFSQDWVFTCANRFQPKNVFWLLSWHHNNEYPTHRAQDCHELFGIKLTP